MQFINVPSVYNLQPHPTNEHLSFATSVFDGTVAIVKRMKVRSVEEAGMKLNKLSMAADRTNLIKPIGYYKDPSILSSKNVEIIIVLAKYDGSVAQLKQQKIDNDETFTKHEIHSIANSIMRALISLQKNSHFHANLTPSKLLYKEGSPTIYIADAGFLTQNKKHLEMYCAPEQIPDHEFYLDEFEISYQLTDTFQFGLVLAELLSLESIEDLQFLKHQAKPEQKRQRDDFFEEMSRVISSELLEILKQLLEIDPNERKLMNQLGGQVFSSISAIETGPEIGKFPRKPKKEPTSILDFNKVSSETNTKNEKDNHSENDQQKLEQRPNSLIKMVDSQKLEGTLSQLSQSEQKQQQQQKPEYQKPKLKDGVEDLSMEDYNESSSNIGARLLQESFVIPANSGTPKFTNNTPRNAARPATLVESEMLISESNQPQQPQFQQVGGMYGQKRTIFESVINPKDDFDDNNNNNNHRSTSNNEQNHLSNTMKTSNMKQRNSWFAQATSARGTQEEENLVQKQSGIERAHSREDQGDLIHQAVTETLVPAVAEKPNQLNLDESSSSPSKLTTQNNINNPDESRLSEATSAKKAQKRLVKIAKIVAKTKNCIEKNDVNLLDVFVFYDQDYDYQIQSDSTLKKVFMILGLLHSSISESDVELTFEFFSVTRSNMPFLPFVKQCVAPKQFAVSLLQNLLKIKGIGVLDLFEMYQAPLECNWGLEDFSRACIENAFPFDASEQKLIFNQLLAQVKSQDAKLNAKEFSTVLSFKLQATSEVISSQIDARVQSQIKRLTDIQFEMMNMQRREIQENKQAQVVEQARLKSEQELAFRKEREEQQRKNQQAKEKEKRDYELAKKKLPSIAAKEKTMLPINAPPVEIVVNRQKFWKSFADAVKSDGSQAILEKLTGKSILAKDFYSVLVEAYKYTDCIELHEFVDSISPNQNIRTDLILEKLNLTQADLLPKSWNSNVVLPDEMEEEIKSLFKLVDKDSSGTIDMNEIETLLALCGLNPQHEQLDAYFKRFDQDGSGTISEEEFRVILIEWIFESMSSVRDIIDKLKLLFHRADVNNTGSLSKPQMRHVLLQMGIDLNDTQLDALVKSIDKDGDGQIDIQELLTYIRKDPRSLKGEAASAVIKIRSSQKPRITELTSLFQRLPSNYRLSFIYNRIKNFGGIVLPASGIKPRISTKTGMIADLQLIYSTSEDQNSAPQAQIKDTQYSLIDGSITPSSILAEITFEKAVLIPQSTDQDILKMVKRREIVVSLYDKYQSRFLGNSCMLEVKDMEGTSWMLSNKQPIIIRWNNYNEKHDEDIVLLIEFVAHLVIESKKVVSVSCAFAEIYLSDLREEGVKNITLSGGDIERELALDEVKTQKNSSSISVASQNNSRLRLLPGIAAETEPILVARVASKATTTAVSALATVAAAAAEKERIALAALPSTIILTKPALRVFKAFREYIAENVKMGLQSPKEFTEDISIRTFASLVNCPDTFDSLCELWNSSISQKVKGSVDLEIQAIKSVLRVMQVLLSDQNFEMNAQDPTLSSYNSEDLFVYRRDLFKYLWNEVLGSEELNYKPKNELQYPEFAGGSAGGAGFAAHNRFNDEEDEFEDQHASHLQQQKNKQKEEERFDLIQSNQRESVIGEDHLLLFAPEDFSEKAGSKVGNSKMIVLDFREQISRGRPIQNDLERIFKVLCSTNSHLSLSSLYLKLSRSCYDEEPLERIKLEPLFARLKQADVRLSQLYLHFDYNDLDFDRDNNHIILDFLKLQQPSLESLNLSFEKTRMSDEFGIKLAKRISHLKGLRNLSLNVSLNDLSSDFVVTLADSLKQLVNLRSLKLDLERIDMHEGCLSCCCGYYLRIYLQFIPLLGPACLWCFGLYSALEKLSKALRQLQLLQHLNLNIAANNIGDRLLRHFEYSFGHTLYTRPHLATLILNLKRNNLVSKSLKSLQNLAISTLKVDLRHNRIEEEGLQKIPPTLMSLHNLENLRIQLDGNTAKKLLLNQSTKHMIVPQNPQDAAGAVAATSAAAASVDTQIDFRSKRFFENRILGTMLKLPLLEQAEITGIESGQKSMTLKTLQSRARLVKQVKYADQIHAQYVKAIFKDEDELERVASIFCNKATASHLHLDFVYDSIALNSCLQLKYLNPIRAVDFSECSQLESMFLFRQFLDFLTNHKQFIDRVSLGGIHLSELQIETLARSLYTLTKERARPLDYLEYSHIGVARITPPELSFCEQIVEKVQVALKQLYEFNEQIYRAADSQNLKAIQDILPNLGQSTRVLSIRGLITLSYDRALKRVEVTNFVQDNTYGFRIFDLLSGRTLSTDLKRIDIRHSLSTALQENVPFAQSQQPQHSLEAVANQTNYLNDNQFASFLRADLKTTFPMLERLDAVFQPSPHEFPNAIKSLTVKLSKDNRLYLKKHIHISNEKQQQEIDEEIDKDPIERYLHENRCNYVVLFILTYILFLISSVVLPFEFSNECGYGHKRLSHYIFTGVSGLGVAIEYYIICYWILPNQSPKLLKGVNKSWRRRLTEHVKSKGDLYLLLVVSLVTKFEMYTNFLFVSITHTCGYSQLFSAGIIILAVYVICEISMALSLCYSALTSPPINSLQQQQLQQKPKQIKNDSSNSLTDSFAQLTTFLNMSGVSYLMHFKEVRVRFLGCWVVHSSNMTTTTMKVVLNSVPMIVIKMIFLLDRHVEESLDVTSFMLSVIVSILTSLIFGSIMLKKYEDVRYSFSKKGAILCGCISYIRQDIEEYLNQFTFARLKSSLQQSSNALGKKGEQEQVSNNNKKNNTSILPNESKNVAHPAAAAGSSSEKVPVPRADSAASIDAAAAAAAAGAAAGQKQESEPLVNKQNGQQKQQQQEQEKQHQEQQQLQQEKDEQQSRQKIAGESQLSFWERMTRIQLKDFTFFYENAIGELDMHLRFKTGEYKTLFWLASLGYFILSFGLPFWSFESCDEGIGLEIIWIFGIVAAFLMLIEINLSIQLVRSMAEVNRCSFMDFAWNWISNCVVSTIVKANYLCAFVVAVYGFKCFENPLIFTLVFVAVCVSFFSRALKVLRYLLKPILMDSLLPLASRFTILAAMNSMVMVEKLVTPYLPERRITRLRLPENLIQAFSRLILQDMLVIILDICYYVHLRMASVDGESESSNIRGFIIGSFVIALISAIATIRWWAWPLKIDKEADFMQILLRNERINQQSAANTFFKRSNPQNRSSGSEKRIKEVISSSAQAV